MFLFVPRETDPNRTAGIERVAPPERSNSSARKTRDNAKSENNDECFVGLQ